MLKNNAQFAHVKSYESNKLPPEALEPSEQNINGLMTGDFVKVGVLCRSGAREWFWGSFSGVSPHGINLVVDNDLVHTEQHGLSDKSKFTVQNENVLGIIKC